jgi:hypothetical protein
MASLLAARQENLARDRAMIGNAVARIEAARNDCWGQALELSVA